MSNPFVRAASSAFKLGLLPLALVAMAVPLPAGQRHIVTMEVAARKYRVTTKTIRNWISKGLICGFRLPSGRGVRVDLNELDRVMRTIPTTVARPGNRIYGPAAKIVDVPRQAEVVEK